MRFLYRLLLIFPAALVFSHQSIASEDNVRAALYNLISETAECAMFYSILGQGTDSSGSQWADGKRFENLSEELTLSALELAQRINMKPDTVMAMMQDNSQKMGELIGFDAINIRLLTNKYGQSCRAFVENPQERLMYWINKESQ